ncbi:MAG: substrate-binding domain-containing protein [Synergistaceae bacterium]|nr:substrate-binding domain-containing protein [Synergistaceae bacterium]
MKKVLVIAAVVIALSVCAAAFAEPQVTFKNNPAGRTYYLCSSHNAHAYFADSHIALRYAAEYFGVNIVALGPDGWDTAEQARAVEQAIAKSPAGIITRFWDASPLAAVRKAVEAGIPVVVTETRIGTSAADIGGALAYIGLDNKQNGKDTAAELVRIAGDKGKLVCMGNWGASNTDSKLAGVKEYLADYPGWEIIAEVDDKADATAAIEAGKTVVNNYPDATAVIGLDSSSGTGLGKAMEELNKPAGSYKVVVNDREPSVLQYIEEGYIDATTCNKTASAEYTAILVMEDYNNGGLKNVPLSSNNTAAGVHGIPENMYNSALVINKDNVQYFFAEELPNIKTDLYNK